jgi:hypothetical protein
MNTHRPSLRAGLLATAALLTALAAMTGSAGARTRPTSTAVHAVIWPNHIVTIAPKSAKVGKVVVKVKNRDTAPQQLQINGVETPFIEPGGSGQLTVTFKKPGLYSIALPDQAQTYAADYARNATRLRVT